MKCNIKIKSNLNLKNRITILNNNCFDGKGKGEFVCFNTKNDFDLILIIPNKNYNLDIFKLNKASFIYFKSIEGHKNKITSIRHFVNNKNKINNDYIISSDADYIINIWNIINNYNDYNNILKINTFYTGIIFSNILLFNINNNNNNDYVITSSNEDSLENQIKVYNLSNGNFIKYLNDNNNLFSYSTFYLLSWQNKSDYYIIELSNNLIIIYNLLTNNIYSKIKGKLNEYDNFLYGFIKQPYILYVSTSYGSIIIYDLINKLLIKNLIYKNSGFFGITDWNLFYCIIADYINNSFKIFDLIQNKIISQINKGFSNDVKMIYKINTKYYGTSLLTSEQNGNITLLY